MCDQLCETTAMRISLPALKGRSKWKGPHIVNFPINLSQALAQNIAIRTQARSCTILPEFVGLKFLVHNGMDYIPVQITDEMVGHKLGEFATTKKPYSKRPPAKG